MKRLMPFLGLFGSMTTLLCCALPALLVALGLGGALAGLVGVFPQIVWVSLHKQGIFSGAGILLAFGGWLQWRSRYDPCPAEPSEAAACASARKWSMRVYGVSLILYGVGSYFAFLAPALQQ